MSLDSSFKEKASRIHNNIYDYSLVVYKNSKTKIKIICSTHGVFEQTPNHHLRGIGCPTCGKERANKKKRSTLIDFIGKARKVHLYSYDYSVSSYYNSSTKIKIICPSHGVFEQKPNNHLNGDGCPVCALENFIPDNKLTTDNFIEKAVKKHGSIYDYSLVQYINNTQAVKILCPIHGVYEQIPNSHLDGCGCPICAIVLRADICRDTREEFIKKAIKKHGNRYDYSKVIYKNALSKINILCKRHGIYLQTPGSHLYGQGCPSCLESHGERSIAGFLDDLGIMYEREKHFSDCKVKKMLSFDFYIPSKNICIEYDGMQHFKPINYFGGDSSFKKLQKYDNIKNDYCMNRGITLIRISYEDDIQDVLCSFIKPSMQV